MKFLYTLIVLLLINSSVFAQDYPSIYDPLDQEDFSMLPGNLIQMGNKQAERIVFSMSFDETHWKDFVIYKDDAILIDLKKNKQAILRICTTGLDDCLLYYVKGSNKYRLYWNEEKEKWDLNLIPSE